MLLSVVALLTLSASPVNAQTHHCGDIQLVFRNPDLQPGGDGKIHAQGQFFAQFQAIGAGADKIAVFGFSFSPLPVQTDESTTCAAPVWVSGAYIPNYRADLNPDDGFFIPLITPLVPDGEYNAAVHAYDANNNELARFWTLAVVDNCDDSAPGGRCDGDAAQNLKHDKTAPWPMILPGDGKPLEGHKLTIEFGEALASFSVHLNGKDVTAQMKEWPGRVWDADLTPDYGPNGLGGKLPQCTAPAPVQSCIKYGPAYEFTDRDLTSADTIHVEAVDLAGNKAVKDIHIGSSVDGGAITQGIPILVDSVETLEQQAEPGHSAVFKFTITNQGAGDGHPFADATVPGGWTFEWQPTHVVVGPGETKKQELVVNVPAGAAHGLYKVNATLNYRAGSEDKVLTQQLTVGVGASTAGEAAKASAQAASGAKASPLPLPFVALAFALLARRRRA